MRKVFASGINHWYRQIAEREHLSLVLGTSKTHLSSMKSLFLGFVTDVYLNETTSRKHLRAIFTPAILYLYILNIKEKLPLLKFRYFWNYKRNKHSFIALSFSVLLQTCLEQWNCSASAGRMRQLMHVHFMLFAVFQNLQTLFKKKKKKKKKKTCQCIHVPERFFLKTRSKLLWLITPWNRGSGAQTFRKHQNLASSYRTQWKYLVFVNELVSCIPVWRNSLFNIYLRNFNVHLFQQISISSENRSKVCLYGDYRVNTEMFP